jgi:hypothetical protein
VARDEMIKLFNEANEGDDNDVRCRYEAHCEASTYTEYEQRGSVARVRGNRRQRFPLQERGETCSSRATCR